MTISNYQDFHASLQSEKPGQAWPPALQALWWDAKGKWEASHEIAQDLPSSLGARIHAYLHRKEGDEGNAAYWYRRAGVPFCREDLQEELQELVNTCLLKG